MQRCHLHGNFLYQIEGINDIRPLILNQGTECQALSHNRKLSSFYRRRSNGLAPIHCAPVSPGTVHFESDWIDVLSSPRVSHAHVLANFSPNVCRNALLCAVCKRSATIPRVCFRRFDIPFRVWSTSLVLALILEMVELVRRLHLAFHWVSFIAIFLGSCYARNFCSLFGP